jgi:hypothetical protein
MPSLDNGSGAGSNSKHHRFGGLQKLARLGLRDFRAG